VRELLLSGTVLAAFLGGVVALLAPCCVSVMLPAYFAATFRRRSRVLVMTLVFALGVGTVILPIGLGATALSRLISGQHFAVFAIIGLLMTAGGVAMLLGWKPPIPMPAMRGGGRGAGGVYLLGVFSGAASACCAPVLAGVATVSGAVASFPAALTVGVAYVFGMVAPLCALALLWDRRDWGSSRLCTAAARPVRIGRLRVPLSAVISGAVLAVLGALTIVIAFTGPNMGTNGWQAQLTAWLGHVAAVLRNALAWLPGWAGLALVFLALLGVIWAALRRRTGVGETPAEDSAPDTGESCCTPIATDELAEIGPADAPSIAGKDTRS
jgi:cytochrome c biogenesis protein CcdA